MLDAYGTKVVKLDGKYYRVNKGKNGNLLLIPSRFVDLDKSNEAFIEECINNVLKEEEKNEQFSIK